MTLTLTKPDLLGLLASRRLDGIAHDGDPGTFERLVRHLDRPDRNFAIVTP